MKKIFIMLYIFNFLYADCKLPNISGNIKIIQKISMLNHIKDYQVNKNVLNTLCTSLIRFTEGKYHWEMLLVTHPKHPKGAFWFLPHDNEDTAFKSAIYAIQKYGGGLLSVVSKNKRYFNNQDPNRNFSYSKYKMKSCKNQKSASSLYTDVVFSIIDYYKTINFPYLALHNNANSWSGGVGRGGISILKSSKNVQAYPAYKGINHHTKGLRDEDSLVYMAGMQNRPNPKTLQSLLDLGINIKYEVVNKHNNDCSMSNFVVLEKQGSSYYNIETEHGDYKSQKKLIDRLMSYINRGK